METTTPPPVQSLPPTSSDAEDKTVAILSYCTLIGFIIAIVLHQQKKTKLGAFHLRQMVGYLIVSIAGGIAVMIVAGIVAFILGFIIKAVAVLILPLVYFAFVIGMLVLWVMGLIAAIQGQMKPMPVVGEQIQQRLGNMFD